MYFFVTFGVILWFVLSSFLNSFNQSNNNTIYHNNVTHQYDVNKNLYKKKVDNSNLNNKNNENNIDNHSNNVTKRASTLLPVAPATTQPTNNLAKIEFPTNVDYTWKSFQKLISNKNSSILALLYHFFLQENIQDKVPYLFEGTRTAIEKLLFNDASNPIPASVVSTLTDTNPNQNNNLNQVYFDVNDIPQITNVLNDMTGKELVMHFPTLGQYISPTITTNHSTGNIEGSPITKPSVFEQKFLSIPLDNILQNEPLIFHYSYNVNGTPNPNQDLTFYLKNTKKEWSNPSYSVSQLMNEQSLFIRDNNFKQTHSSDPSSIARVYDFLHTSHLRIVRDLNKKTLDFYSVLQNEHDTATFSFADNISEKWLTTTRMKVGFLDNIVMPFHFADYDLANDPDFSIIPQEVSSNNEVEYIDNLPIYSTSSQWYKNANGRLDLGTGFTPRITYEQTIYLEKGQNIKLKINYKGKNDSVHVPGSNDSFLEIDAGDKLTIVPDRFSVDSNIFDSNSSIGGIGDGFGVNISSHKLDIDSTRWYKVDIKSDAKFVTLGEVDQINSVPSRDIYVPQDLDLNQLKKISNNFFFERPLNFNFLGPADIKNINISKEINIKNELPKYVGIVYYNMWNTYSQNDNEYYKILDDNAKYSLNLEQYDFNPNRYDPNINESALETTNKTYEFKRGDRPSNPSSQAPSKPINNMYGDLVWQMYVYVKHLNEITHQIINKDLYDKKSDQYFIPDIVDGPYVFAQERLISHPNIEQQLLINQLKQGISKFETGNYTGTTSPDVDNIQQDDKTSFISFAQSRVAKLFIERIKQVVNEFKSRLDQYRFDFLKKILLLKPDDTNNNELKDNFLTPNINFTENKKWNIKGFGSVEPLVNMFFLKNDFNNKDNSIKNVNRFYDQLYNQIQYLINTNYIKKILKNDYTYFIDNFQYLFTTDALDENKKNLSKFSKLEKLMFIVVDYIYNDNNYSSANVYKIKLPQSFILDVWNLKKYYNIYDSSDEKFYSDTKQFLNDVTNLMVIDKSINFEKFGYQINDLSYQKLNVANNNISEIFKAFTQIHSNISNEALKNIQSWQNINFLENPNKIADLSFLVYGRDVHKFLDNIVTSKETITPIINKMLNMDPLMQLPQNLPIKSKSINFFEKIVQNINIILIVIGALFTLLGGALLLWIALFKNISQKGWIKTIAISFIFIACLLILLPILFTSTFLIL